LYINSNYTGMVYWISHMLSPYCYSAWIFVAYICCYCLSLWMTQLWFSWQISFSSLAVVQQVCCCIDRSRMKLLAVARVTSTLSMQIQLLLYVSWTGKLTKVSRKCVSDWLHLQLISLSYWSNINSLWFTFPLQPIHHLPRRFGEERLNGLGDITTWKTKIDVTQVECS